MPRGKTLDQVEAMQRKALRFVADVLGDSDKADEIEQLSVGEYAARKGIRINPKTKELKLMSGAITKKELEDTLDEVSNKVTEMLNPALTRKEVVVLVQELDQIVNGSSDAEDDEQGDEEDDDEDE